MAGAISNGRVNLEERDPSRAPVKSREAAFLDITNTGEGPSFLSDHTQVVSLVQSFFDITPVSSSHGYIWCITYLKIVFSNFRMVETFSRMSLLQNQWKSLKDYQVHVCSLPDKEHILMFFNLGGGSSFQRWVTAQTEEVGDF